MNDGYAVNLTTKERYAFYGLLMYLLFWWGGVLYIISKPLIGVPLDILDLLWVADVPVVIAIAVYGGLWDKYIHTPLDRRSVYQALILCPYYLVKFAFFPTTEM